MCDLYLCAHNLQLLFGYGWHAKKKVVHDNIKLKGKGMTINWIDSQYAFFKKRLFVWYQPDLRVWRATSHNPKCLADDTAGKKARCILHGSFFLHFSQWQLLGHRQCSIISHASRDHSSLLFHHQSSHWQ